MSENKPLNIEACDQEPIHIPGSIQPHGLLLVADPGTDVILQSAGNAASLLHYRSPVLGATVQEVLGVSLTKLLQQADTTLLHEPTYLGTLRTNSVCEEVTVTAHQVNGTVIVEVEPTFASGPAPKALARVRAIAQQIGAANSTLDACRFAAREVQRLTGYDRVMVYRFLPDGSGSVVAEEKDGHLLPYLNHRFPASDIPKQARDLYRRNPIRVIPDVNYTPEPLLPASGPSTGQPLDMSQCGLRSVSPVHVQYLKNMGVGASMSVSLLQGGELWGLVACHNTTPRLVPYEVREMCKHVGQMLSQFIQAHAEADSYRSAAELSAVREQVLLAFREADDPSAALPDLCSKLQSVVPSHGVAMSWQGKVVTAGYAPPEESIRQLAGWLTRRASCSDLLVTNCLSEHYVEAQEFTREASGLLSIILPDDEPVVLMWFRAEQVEEINWAGNPHKPVEHGLSLGTLSPRKSFETWVETVWARSHPWTQVEVEAVLSFRPRAAFILQQHRIRKLNHLLSEANEQLSALATTDGLTGIANRRAFDTRLEIEWASAARYGRPLALITLDVDFFKQYNDHFGHPTGDECLRGVADAFRRGHRVSDFPARTGGEEFCVLLPDTDIEGAHSVAEAIRIRIEKLRLEHPKSPMGVVTVSIGIAAAIPSATMAAGELLEVADQALYEAKRNGRNRVLAGGELAALPSG